MTFKTTIKTIFFVLSFMATNSFGQDSFTFNFSGNAKTKDSYIQALVDTCFEDMSDAVDRLKANDRLLNEIRQCLINSRIFHEVSVTAHERQINISVKERFTIIPIPLMAADSAGNRKVGFFLLESNLFGYGKLFVLGSTLSTGGYEFFRCIKIVLWLSPDGTLA